MFLKCPVYARLPYIGPLSIDLHFQIRNILHKHFPQCNFLLSFINNNSIGNYFKIKESIPLCLRSCIVYKYECADCHVDYVGQTSLQLKIRAFKHMGISFRTNLPISHPEYSAIRDHSNLTKHPISLQNFSILQNASNDEDLKILESLYIKTINPTLNTQNSSLSLLIA
ncbi:UNVERIFIED_CONTAM: hypothetical protein RMT77_017855 [Armadillidium vulgare]